MKSQSQNLREIVKDRSDIYETIFDSINNNTIIGKMNKDGVYIPISCTSKYLEMMECTFEEYSKAESETPFSTVHPDDKDKLVYLFRHGETETGEKHLVIRLVTMKGNIVWADVCYALFTIDGEDYVYANCFEVTQLKENENRIKLMYEELNSELHSISDDALAIVRTNSLSQLVEEVTGKDLFDCDKPGENIEVLLKRRLESMPNPHDRERYLEGFKMENLVNAYNKGINLTPLIIFTKRQSGWQGFVKYSIGLREDPKTGNIMVFGVEQEYNSEKISEILKQNILSKQYDMISYIVNGNYGVVIGDGKSIVKGSIFPKKLNGVYMDYINEQVIPFVYEKDNNKQEILKALSLDTIEKELSKNDSYTVNVTCNIKDELFYKKFTFYLIDPDAKFYLLLKSDYTETYKEQLIRNEQMKQALEEARQANIAKTAFLSNMSHEIRTPMNAIIGLNSIALKEKTLSDKMRLILNQIDSSAKHLLELINNILDMSRIESGRIVLKNEEFSFVEMIEQIDAMVVGQCKEKHLKYDCVINGILDEYYVGDVTKLKQIFINLLSNSIKFTPDSGKITFVIEKIAEYDNKSSLRFTVKDNGIGMDKDFIPKLFDPFEQEYSTTTTQYAGSGLGMAITKNIIEIMNGNISVKSEKNIGTEFIVNITLGNSKKKNEHKNKSVVNPEELDVLIIDNNPIACNHSKLVLEKIGVASDYALSGKEAIELIKLRQARGKSYNLILVDLYMPEQDGIEVTREIRKIVDDKVAVIVLTAYSWDDILEEAEKAGVDKFLAKPLFSSNALELFSNVICKKETRVDKKVKETVELAGKRILLAEDMVINAEIMRQVLQMSNIEVEVASNGKIAVEMFSNSPEYYYDAILMDIRMPVLDGLGATKAIRALDRADVFDIPIIAMTANAFDEDVQLSLQAGMNAHLSKPVEPELLIKTLKNLIK